MQKKLKEWGKESRKSGDFVETVEQVFLDPALAKNSQRLYNVRMNKKTKDIASELGRLGGEKTLEKHGTEHYSRMAKKRWEKKKKEEEEK